MRYIALPEFQPGLRTSLFAPSSYFEKTNGTLEQEMCVLRIDENGFMVSKKTEQPQDTKILMLGGSSIENLYIAEHRRVATRVEDTLCAWGKDAKVYSAGISNTNLLHIINTVLNKGIPLRPKLIVYYVTLWPDLLASQLENGFWNAAICPLSGAEQEPTDLAEELVPAEKSLDELAAERRLLCVLSDICANFEIRLFMTTWPIYEYDDFAKTVYPDRSIADDQREQAFALNELVRQTCRDKHCVLIDLEKDFEGLNLQQYFYDLVHPNAQGCEKVASLTSEVLRSYV